MPVVPIIQQDTKLDPVGTSGKLDSVSNPYIARDTSGLMNAFKGLVDDYNKSKKQYDLLGAQKNLNDWEAQHLYDTNKGAYAQLGEKAIGIAQPTLDQFDKDGKALLDTYKDADTRQRVAEMVQNRRDSVQLGLLQHQTTQTKDAVVSQSAAMRSSNADRAVLNYTNPAIVDFSLQHMNAATDLKGNALGWTQAQIDDEKADNQSGLTAGILKRTADENPAAALDYFKANVSKLRKDDLLQAAQMMKPIERGLKSTSTAQAAIKASLPGATPDDIISNTIRLEGGSEMNVDSGGLTKYGISKKAHPDTDIANLTEQDARTIYKNEYWDAAKIGDLPENMQAIAFDTVVNHGVAGGSLLIKEANGDPVRLLQLRAARYEQLSQSPEHKDDLKGWMNRLSDLAQLVHDQRNTPPNEMSAYKYITENETDPTTQQEAWTKAKDIISSYKAQQTQTRNDAEDAYFRYVNAGQQPPPSVISDLDPKRYYDIVQAKTDPVLEGKLREAVMGGANIDLGEYRTTIGNKAYEDLTKLQKDPVANADARSVDSVVKDSLPVILGQKEVKTADDAQKVEQFRRAYQQAYDQFKKANGGNNPKPQDVNDIKDRLLMTVTKNPDDFFGGSDVHYFEMASDEKPGFEVPGIPKSVRYYMKQTPQNGTPFMQEASYNDIVDTVTALTEKRGLPLTEDNIKSSYDLMKARGLLTWR